MTDDVPRLVVLRGPSAAGKTTLAAALQTRWGPGVANVGQDHLRRVVLREHERPGADNVGLIASTVRWCVAAGYHVVLEGMLRTPSYGAMLRELLDEHPGRTDVLHLDVSLDDVLRRHEGRPLASVVSAALVREWYEPADLLGIESEARVDGSGDLATTLARVVEALGPLRPLPQHDPERFVDP